MKQSMVIYYSFYEAILDLPPKNQLEVFIAICKFGFTEEEPELTGISNTVFKLIRPQLEANNRKAAIGIANGSKGADYGHLGGRPAKEKPPRNPQETPIEGLAETPKKPSNVNDNNNDNVNKNNNKNNNVNGNENKNLTPPTNQSDLGNIFNGLLPEFSEYINARIKSNVPFKFNEEWAKRKDCYYGLVLNNQNFQKKIKNKNISEDDAKKYISEWLKHLYENKLDQQWDTITDMCTHCLNFINLKLSNNGKPNAKNTVAYIQQQQMREPARDFGEL